jgi:hypothetical protein
MGRPYSFAEMRAEKIAPEKGAVVKKARREAPSRRPFPERLIAGVAAGV